MRIRRLFGLLVVLGTLFAVALPVGAQAPGSGDREIRLIVSAFKQELSQAESYEAFRASVLDHFETHVVPLLADDKPSLVVYPERLDRIAMLIGLRGQAARDQLADGASPGTARLALYGPYAPQITYYRTQFDGLADTQYLQLALTDTVVRGVVETFSEVAKRHGAHVFVGSALPAYEATTGPESAVLSDPEVGSGAAYVATEPEVFAQTLVIRSDGAVVAKTSKIYLDGAEVGTSFTSDGLTPGMPTGLRVVDLPFARLGIVAGQDAQMPDLASRLDLLGAEVLVQPRSGGPWASFPRDPSLWPPDRFRRGGWLAVQRHPSLRTSATGVLTGNLGSAISDGQPAIAAHSTGNGGCLVGGGQQRDWAAVGPWSALGLDDDRCTADQREELTRAAAALAPGSGDDREGAYAHGAVAADIRLPGRALATRIPRGEFSASLPTPGTGDQALPSVSAGVEGAWLAWVDTRTGRRRIFAATTPDGTSWSEPKPVWPLSDPFAGHTNDQTDPTVLVPEPPTGDVVPGLSVSPSVDAHVVFGVVEGHDWDIYSARHDPRERSWGSRQRVDRGPSESIFGDDADALRAHGEPVLTSAPDGTMVAAWSDLRWPYVLPQVRIATSVGGEDWDGRQRVDGGPDAPRFEDAAQPHYIEIGETRGQTSPALTFSKGGRLLVAWQEPSSEGVPGIYMTTSSDVARSFAPPQRIDGTTNPSYRPVLVSGEQLWVIWEDQLPGRGRHLMVRRSSDEGETWTAPRRVDPDAPDKATQSRAAAVPSEDGVVVVFEDDRAGDTDVVAVNLGAEGVHSRPIRVDDDPGGANAYGPKVAVLSDGRLLVAWEDRHDGVGRVRTSASPWPNRVPEPHVEPRSTLISAPVELPATGGTPSTAAVGFLVVAVAISYVRRV